jgi:hypothetical protein
VRKEKNNNNKKKKKKKVLGNEEITGDFLSIYRHETGMMLGD